MKNLKSILLATDFDLAAERAVEAVVPLARAFDARVAILHVLEPMPSCPVALHHREAFSRDRLREVSERLGRQQVAVADATVATGSRAGEIFNQARAVSADLLMLGAGKTLPSGRLLPGPVAETVVELAVQPVIAVHPRAPAPTVRRVLCPVDHSPASGRGLRSAVALARACGSHLVVLSVVPEIGWFSAAMETGQLSRAVEEYRRTWTEEFERFLEGVNFAGVSWEKEVREGAPDREIVAAALRHEADVISMGSTGRSGLIRILMGSVTRHVFQDLPCSLLTVKDKDLVDESAGAAARAVADPRCPEPL